MTEPNPPRAHLVERAIEAMTGQRLPPAERRPPAAPTEPASVQDGGVPSDDGRSGARSAAPSATSPASPVEVLAAATVALAPRPGREAAPRPQPIGISALRQAGLAFVPDTAPRSRISEELTLVQQQLLRSIAAPGQVGRPNVGRHTVLVTSARSGEGKSFIALNLAASIASSTSHQVILVDVDGFGSSLTQALSLGEAMGLRSLAANPSQPKEPLLRPTAIDRLSILPHGAPLPGSPAPPAGAAMAAAIRALAVAMPHHIIVLDAPPALATSDANALAPVVGQVVLVVQAEETPRDEVEAALDVVEACPSLHLLLNQTRFTANDSFGAYGAYGGSNGA